MVIIFSIIFMGRCLIIRIFCVVDRIDSLEGGLFGRNLVELLRGGFEGYSLVDRFERYFIVFRRYYKRFLFFGL